MGGVGFLAAAMGGSSLWIGNVSFGVAALFSVLFLALVLISRGFNSQSPNVVAAEYFGANSQMASKTTLESLGSSWVMLGNVVVAGMFLGQAFGILSVWIVLTWWFAFVLMSRRVAKVRSVLGPEDTLHTFLHRTYGSRGMRSVAAIITIIVGFGVFCIELIAGMALLIAVLPSPQGAVIAPFLILLLLVAMCVACIAGGLPAVIRTDSMLWPIVIGGMGVMLVVAGVHMYHSTPEHLVQVLMPTAIGGWAGVAFLVGVAALQVPLLLGDYGTWQRIKATKMTTESETVSLVRHTLKQAWWQALLWAVPILAGMALVGLPPLYATQSGSIYTSSAPLIEAIRQWIDSTNVPLLLRVAIVTLFLIGMLSVMASTANSYLLIAMETAVRDLRLHHETSLPSRERDLGYVARARVICGFLAVMALFPTAALIGLNINLLGMIIIVFSVQVALAPAAVLALYHEEAARRLSLPVVISTLSGFLIALVYGFFTSYGLSGWWQDYGAFLTAVVALGVPTLTIVVALPVLDGYDTRSSRAFLAQLFWPWG